MPKVLTTTVTLQSISLKSIMLYKDRNGVIVADLCYDVLQDNGSTYENGKHTVVPIPDILASTVAAQWASAITTAMETEELA